MQAFYQRILYLMKINLINNQRISDKDLILLRGTKDPMMRTILHWSVILDCKDFVKRLVKLDYDPSQEDFYQKSAIDYAIQLNNSKAMKLLVSYTN